MTPPPPPPPPTLSCVAWRLRRGDSKARSPSCPAQKRFKRCYAPSPRLRRSFGCIARSLARGRSVLRSAGRWRLPACSACCLPVRGRRRTYSHSTRECSRRRKEKLASSQVTETTKVYKYERKQIMFLSLPLERRALRRGGAD